MRKSGIAPVLLPWYNEQTVRILGRHDMNNVNEVTLAAMDAAEHNEDMHGPFDSVQELMEALNA